QASSVLLARQCGSPEVFVVARAAALRFLGGFLAFPGGKVHSSDHELACASPGLTCQHVAAVRELFEEIGVLLAHDATGAFPTAEGLARLRRELMAEQMTFNDLLAERHLHLRPEDLVFAGSLVTPSFSPYRFDTAFFVAVLPPGQTAEVWPGELTDGAWCSAASLYAEWIAGDKLLAPPPVALLSAIEYRPIEDVPQRSRPLRDELAAGAIHCISFRPAVWMIPLLTQGLPPSTHTNAYLVGTRDCKYLLDPGPTDAAEQQRLFDRIGRKPLAGVILTH